MFRTLLSKHRGQEMLRRLVYFWVVWSTLLLVHESGHALSEWRRGQVVERVTVGARGTCALT
jgi:hypothetical protein